MERRKKRKENKLLEEFSSKVIFNENINIYTTKKTSKLFFEVTSLQNSAIYTYLVWVNIG